MSGPKFRDLEDVTHLFFHDVITLRTLLAYGLRHEADLVQVVVG